LTVHHTWGVPVIPGSALKGLLNHYVDAVYGPAVTGMHPMDPDFPQEERDRAPFRGVTWAGKRIEHGPGEVHRALFGAPRAKSDRLFQAFGAGETVGHVMFHDALFVPEGVGEQPFAVDVLTVHQRSYYGQARKQAGSNECPLPNDYDDLNPVSFLTVRPDTRFLVAMSGPSEWTQLAFGLLRDALIEWGVGGKTTSGYGHIRKEDWKAIWPEEPPPSAVVEELGVWLSSTKLEQRPKLEQLPGETWLPRLRAASSDEKREIAKLIRKEIKSKKLTAERDQIIAEIMNEPVETDDRP
jgi:CRISPR-associated protein Cmr6